jgi:hypothetical protein
MKLRARSARLSIASLAAATRRLLPALPVVAGCVDAPATSEIGAASTVGSWASSGSCSTAVVLGLSRQIADEIACEHAGSLVPFSATGNIAITSNAVLPYLEADAKADLDRVAQNHSLQVNSAFRTIAQQYLLYEWYLQGSCGITAAARVGSSNHESGRAVDLANWSSEIGAMSTYGWAHDVPGDSVHFDHVASTDIRGQDVHAFQVLWNRNNPGDPIGEDGAYGPQTQARLVASPATGFANGPTCGGAHAHVASVVSIDGPDEVAQQTQATYAITIANGGTTDWPATTTIALADAAPSPLHDPSWISDSVVATLGADVAAGAQATFAITVSAPTVATDTPYTLQLALVSGAATLDTIAVSFTVVPALSQPASSDGNEEPPARETGGCAASAGGGWLAGLALALALTSGCRRRRPS